MNIWEADYMSAKLENIIREKCERFAKEYWNLEFNIPIEISNKMTITLGYYKSRRNRCVVYAGCGHSISLLP